MTELQLHDFVITSAQEEQLAASFHGDIFEYKIFYDSDFRSAKILREITDYICRNCGIIPKWRTRIVLILDELHNNAIEYGSMQGDINTFYLKIRKCSSEEFYLEARITDTGRGLKAKKAVQMEKIRKEHQNEDFSHHSSIRWRGLFLIISHLVDTLAFEDAVDAWLAVTITKRLSLNS